MTGDFVDDAERLREEAATWFARMRRPDAEAFRAEFEQWLSKPDHLIVYNRIAERFSDGKVLRSRPEPVANASKAKSRVGRALMVAAATVLAIIAAGLIAALSGPFRPQFPSKPEYADLAMLEAGAPVELATARGEIRHMRLVDGSIVTLDADSLLMVSFTGSTRHLRLERGRARFDVTHERRPFMVSAGKGTITAGDTVFDVALDGHHAVQVALLNGKVEIAARYAAGIADPVLHVLEAGSAAIIEPSGKIVLEQFAAAQSEWPSGMADFDKVPLGRVIEQAARYSTLRIRIDDPELASRPISGRFRVDQPEKLADNLADILTLQIDRRTPGEILLRPR